MKALRESCRLLPCAATCSTLASQNRSCACQDWSWPCVQHMHGSMQLTSLQQIVIRGVQLQQEVALRLERDLHRAPCSFRGTSCCS